MANKRMINAQVICSDSFRSLPISSQGLYMQLNAEADDDGVCDKARQIMLLSGATKEDLEALVEKEYLIKVQEVYIISHWKLHNTIKGDRYKKTIYQKEFNEVFLDENKVYKQKTEANKNEWRQNGDSLETDCLRDGTTVKGIGLGLDKGIGLGLDIDSGIDKVGNTTEVCNTDKEDSKENPPTYTNRNPDFISVLNFFLAIGGNNKEAIKFFRFYETKDWKDSNKKPVTNWQAKAKLWHTDQR